MSGCLKLAHDCVFQTSLTSSSYSRLFVCLEKRVSSDTALRANGAKRAAFDRQMLGQRQRRERAICVFALHSDVITDSDDHKSKQLERPQHATL